MGKGCVLGFRVLTFFSDHMQRILVYALCEIFPLTAYAYGEIAIF
jgi:hypothetical protein